MQKALFLDRDGVVNHLIKKFSKFYNKIIDDSPFSLAELKLNKSLIKVVNEAKKRGYKIIIVTNQPSIVKGDFNLKDYEEITTKVCEYLKIDRGDVFECLHKEGFSLPCLCRKPKPGLILMAKGVFNLNLEDSLIVGDSASDIIAGQNAGLKKTIFIRRKESNSQIGNLFEEKMLIDKKIKPSHILDDIKDLVNYL